MTRDANRNIGLAMLKSDPAEQESLYREALAGALGAIEADPQNPRGWFLAGQVYARLKDYAAADSSYTRAVTLYPNYAGDIDGEREEAWVMAYNDAIAAYQAGDMDGAITGMEDANRIYRKRPEALQVLASFYANRDEVDKAIAAYRGALEILRDPSLLPADEELRKQWAEGEEEATLNTGMLLASTERYAEAEQVYREFITLHPDHLGAQVNLATALAQQGKTAEAAEVFQKLSSRTDLTDNHYLMIGIGMFNADDFEAAANAFRSAATKNPYSRDAHLNLSKALLRISLQLEEERGGKANPAVDPKLTKVYEEMVSEGEKTLALDPYNREVLGLIMRAQESMRQMAGNAQAVQRYQAQMRETVKRYEEAPIDVENISIQTAEGEVTISGTLLNLKLNQGSSVTLRFSVLTASGTVVGTKDVSVSAGRVETSAPFRVTIPVSAPMEAWKYERVQ
jgi:tetratricopeptide (TPR) repeat protein